MINKEKSRILDLDGTARHDQLYYYSKIKNEHLKLSQGMSSPSMTFQPTINSSFDCERTRQTFFERQQADCKQREFKQQLINEMNSTSSLRSGMTPKIGRGPLTGSSVKLDKGHELYEAAFKTKSIIDAARREKEELARRKANEQKILATSNNFMEELASTRIEEIFEILDSNGDGIISCSRVNVEGLDSQILKILKPTILYMEKYPDISYDLQAFTSIVKNYMKVLSSQTENLHRRAKNTPRPRPEEVGLQR